MSFIEAIILGIIQGATEFLPISSSGHLILLPSIFDLNEPNLNAIAIAHQGTLLAVLIYFRHDLRRIIRAVFEGLRARTPLAETESRLGWFIAFGSLPAIVVGLFFADSIDRVLAKLNINDPLLDIARKLEEVALKDSYFIDHNLYPNVDFYSGIVLRAMGIPTNMFTVMFAIGRLPGWISQWKESMDDPHWRISRPRQIYIGKTEEDYVPIDERLPDDR